MVGNKDASLTLNTYAELFEDGLDHVAARLDEAVLRVREDSLGTVARIGPLARGSPGASAGP